MKIYRVGGSVRDELMGLTPHDHDYVVVGATPGMMESAGFKQVGKDFPVYLHPENGEEYALARKERKTGLRHTDFETTFDTSVTIEDDLLRRDLTINAIAVPYNFEGEIVDPFGGQEDIKNKVLRHVSWAFAEDPLRILRLARFTSKFSDFSIHDDTLWMVDEMVKTGALDHISYDRIWGETKKALISDHPEEFFKRMEQFGALKYLTNQSVNDIYDCELMEQVSEATKYFSNERKLLVRAAAYFAYYYPNFSNAKAFRKMLGAARIPSDIIDLATFAGENADELIFRIHILMPIKELMEAFDRFNLRVMVQKNPNFFDDMYIIINSFDENMKEYDRMKFVMKAYLDTKEFLACKVKRFKWATGAEPTTTDYKHMLEDIRYENVSTAMKFYFSGVVCDTKKGKLHMGWGPGYDQSN